MPVRITRLAPSRRIDVLRGQLVDFEAAQRDLPMAPHDPTAWSAGHLRAFEKFVRAQSQLLLRLRGQQRLPGDARRGVAVVARDERVGVLEDLERGDDAVDLAARSELVVEALELRVKDVSIDRKQLDVRGGKGNKDRVTVLPANLASSLQRQLKRVELQHARDLECNAAWVTLPAGLSTKYPAAARELAWQYLFPAARVHLHEASGQRRRHHLHESAVQRAVKAAVRSAGIAKRAIAQFSVAYRFAPSPT